MTVTKELGLDPAKVNPNGGAVALGHPIGATGAILTVKCLYELQRTGGRSGSPVMFRLGTLHRIGGPSMLGDTIRNRSDLSTERSPMERLS